MEQPQEITKAKKPRSKVWMYLEVIMLLLWIITTIAFLSQVRSKGAQCLANPLIYGSKVLEEKNNASFNCQCKFSNSPQYTIFANSRGWNVKADIALTNETAYKYNLDDIFKDN